MLRRRQLKGFYLYYLFLSVFLTRITYATRFAVPTECTPLSWILENRGKQGKQGKKGGMSCYEIEHPTDGNREECQNFSKENLFTDLRHSGTKKARLGALVGSR
jgi:hypothetical protein